jgi:CRISPR-associated protein Cas2
MVYDVGVERVSKVLKVGRVYLTWIQNSVLEGEISEADLIKLKKQTLIIQNVVASNDMMRLPLFYTLLYDKVTIYNIP